MINDYMYLNYKRRDEITKKVAVYASFKNRNRKVIDYFLNQVGNWCIMKNYDYTIYFDKIQNSTSLKNRRELEDLKTDIEQKKYSKIIIKDISHLSRNVNESF